jgi:hypothetical protein
MPPHATVATALRRARFEAYVRHWQSITDPPTNDVNAIMRNAKPGTLAWNATMSILQQKWNKENEIKLGLLQNRLQNLLKNHEHDEELASAAIKKRLADQHESNLQAQARRKRELSSTNTANLQHIADDMRARVRARVVAHAQPFTPPLTRTTLSDKNKPTQSPAVLRRDHVAEYQWLRSDRARELRALGELGAVLRRDRVAEYQWLRGDRARELRAVGELGGEARAVWDWISGHRHRPRG